MRTTPRTPLLPLVLLALAGCGGGGGGNHSSATAGATSVVFSKGASYNGSTVTLTGNAGASGINTGTNIALSTGDRFFEIAVPSSAVTNGGTADLSSTDNIVIYEEGENNDKTWKATAGTLKFSGVSTGSGFGENVTVTLTGVKLSPSDVFGTTTATGTFQLDGTVVAKASTTSDD